MYPLEVEHLTKNFGSLKILSDISFSVEEGTAVAIVGKSGTGKSTLLHICGGLDKPTSGKVLCNGKELYMLPDKKISQIRNREIGFIFQSNLLLEDFNALENVMVPALICGEKKAKCTERAEELLFRTGLKDRLKHYPAQLSGGEKQRVAICRALINNPALVLADEPTGSLDEENAEEVENILFEIVMAEKKTLLLVTHNVDFANRCTRVLRLQNHVLFGENK